MRTSRVWLLGTLQLATLLVVAACEDAPLPGPPDSGTLVTDAGLGDAGVSDTGMAEAPDAGEVADSCEALQARFEAWYEAHKSCTDETMCTALAPPLTPIDVLCASAAVLDEGADEALANLGAHWEALGCDWLLPDGNIVLACPGAPATTTSCEAGVCVFKVDPSGIEACLACYDEPPDYVCVNYDGQLSNAYNECAAVNCLGADAAHITPGFCGDTPECIAQGGTCNPATEPGAQRCPDGQRWASEAAPLMCGAGQIPTTCCVPWDQDCTFVANGIALERDPFTCEDLGLPICMRGTEAACSYETTFEQGIGNAWNAEVMVQMSTGNQITVSGTHRDTGRTFQCEGRVSHDLDPEQLWACQGCDAQGANCVTCEVPQHFYCSP